MNFHPTHASLQRLLRDSGSRRFIGALKWTKAGTEKQAKQENRRFLATSKVEGKKSHTERQEMWRRFVVLFQCSYFCLCPFSLRQPASQPTSQPAIQPFSQPAIQPSIQPASQTARADAPGIQWLYIICLHGNNCPNGSCWLRWSTPCATLQTLPRHSPAFSCCSDSRPATEFNRETRLNPKSDKRNGNVDGKACSSIPVGPLEAVMW